MNRMLLWLIVLQCMCSCISPSGNRVQIVEELPAAVDTIVTSISDPSFPDTMYASAEQVTYQIDVMDSLVSSNLSDYEDLYCDAPGIFMFRGSRERNPNFNGQLHGDTVKFSVEWVFVTSKDTTHTSHGVWGGGTGWTGQPIYIHWPDSLVDLFKASSPALTENFSAKELMVASLCGKVYFIDFETGKASRECYDTENVLKGTPSLNPFLNGQLYVGHGVQKTRPFGAIVFNLFSHEQTNAFGRDNKAWRSWDAYDSSPVAIGGFLFRPGENGTLYKYYIGDGGYRLHSALRYSMTKYKYTPGIESSMAVCRNYGYLTDNAGNVLCVNLNTLKPVWHYFNHDDTDATPVVSIEDGIPYIYTGCEVDRQGNSGNSHFVKLNGLTGELVWETLIPCQRYYFDDKSLDGGMYSSPLLGERDCDSLIFNNFCINSSTIRGYFTAFNKKDGHIVYQTETKHYCWSSPVAFYRDDEMFVFTADAGGNVYLIKGTTGKIVATAKIGSNFESSPIVVDDKVIIGSRGNKIYKIALE